MSAAWVERGVHRGQRVCLPCRDGLEYIGEKLRSLSEVSNVVARKQAEADLWEVNLQSNNSRAVLPKLVESIGQNGTRLVNMNIVKPSLEDVFIHLTGKALRD